MKNKTLKDVRASELNNGKAKAVGFFESIPLKKAGKRDGKNGLLRETDGCWMSPRIEKEIRSYDEYASRIWGQLQFEEENEYARLEGLIESVVLVQNQLDDARQALAGAEFLESKADNNRKKGESKLTIEQVADRRAREREKRLSSVKSRVSSLETRLSSEREEFSKARAKIIEDNNSARMICNRVRDHIYQRLAVYWDSVLRYHPDSCKMPVVPSVNVRFRSEEVYMKPHNKVLMEKAELLMKTLPEEESEVA